MSLLGKIMSSMQKAPALSGADKAQMQRDAERKKQIEAYRQKVVAQLNKFKTNSTQNSLKYPETNLALALRNVIYEEASKLGFKADEFGPAGIDQFIMVFKKPPPMDELRSMHEKYDGVEMDDVAPSTQATERSTAEDDAGAAEDDAPPEEDNYEDEEDAEYPYQELYDDEGDELGDYEAGTTRPAHSLATRLAKASQKVATRLPQRAAEKRESLRQRLAAEADPDVFPTSAPKSSYEKPHDAAQQSFKVEIVQNADNTEIGSLSTKRKRDGSADSESSVAKKIKKEDSPQ